VRDSSKTVALRTLKTSTEWWEARARPLSLVTQGCGDALERARRPYSRHHVVGVRLQGVVEGRGSGAARAVVVDPQAPPPRRCGPAHTAAGPGEHGMCPGRGGVVGEHGVGPGRGDVAGKRVCRREEGVSPEMRGLAGKGRVFRVEGGPHRWVPTAESGRVAYHGRAQQRQLSVDVAPLSAWPP